MIEEFRSLRTHIRHRLMRLRGRGKPYAEFYADVMKMRAEKDPKLAVGGMWEEMGRLQFEFLTGRGLAERHRLLDIGCGSLRGGLHFIRHLAPGNYCGVDISPEILDAARKHVAEAGLLEKRPQLGHVRDLKWNDFNPAPADYALAFSVLTHMPMEDVEDCFAHLDRVIAPGGTLYATVFLAEKARVNREGDTFWHRLDDVRAAAARHGWRAELVEDFEHPRGQKMLQISRERD